MKSPTIVTFDIISKLVFIRYFGRVKLMLKGLVFSKQELGVRLLGL